MKFIRTTEKIVSLENVREVSCDYNVFHKDEYLITISYKDCDEKSELWVHGNEKDQILDSIAEILFG